MNNNTHVNYSILQNSLINHNPSFQLDYWSEHVLSVIRNYSYLSLISSQCACVGVILRIALWIENNNNNINNVYFNSVISTIQPMALDKTTKIV